MADSPSSSSAMFTRKKISLGKEEDEEKSRDDELPVSGSDIEDEEEEEGSGEEEEESEPEIPELMVPNRSRRANAGRRMQELMNQQIAGQEVENDNFYGKEAYGGFQEMDQDDDFESPPHTSDEEQQDEVDSDFDQPDEEEDDKEEEEKANRAIDDAERAERRRKKMKQQKMLERNKNWAIARINKMSVPENSCDPKTQKQRLQEAKKTAELNIASLKRFEEFELERKKRQSKAVPKRVFGGPRIREIMSADGTHLLILPELPPKGLLFPRPDRREYKVCAVTGKPARYIDPLTKLPFADTGAFNTIRQKYKEFLATQQEHAQQKNDSKKNGVMSAMAGSGGADAMGFAKQPTPAKQRRLTAAAQADHGAPQQQHYMIRVDDI